MVGRRLGHNLNTLTHTHMYALTYVYLQCMYEYLYANEYEYEYPNVSVSTWKAYAKKGANNLRVAHKCAVFLFAASCFTLTMAYTNYGNEFVPDFHFHYFLINLFLKIRDDL